MKTKATDLQEHVAVFEALPRQRFRDWFQPSRVLLCVLNDPATDRANIITLCFSMHASYKPTMMAFAIWRHSLSHSLAQKATECVLAVPGEKLAEAAMTCGTQSGADLDKWVATGLTPVASQRVAVPSIRECIANVELRIASRCEAGDHLLLVGEVLQYGVDKSNLEQPLLSVGPREEGYKVLARSGIHRLAVVDARGGAQQ
tara:strand:- start:4216 stop:4821 length:606 start_codon:yes stop_codon:yes gene_type:complete